MNYLKQFCIILPFSLRPMITCQYCTTPWQSPNAKEYLSHLKEVHSRQNFGEFVCPYESCQVKFHKSNRFKAHLDRHEIRHENCNNPPPIINAIVPRPLISNHQPLLNEVIDIQEPMQLEEDIAQMDENIIEEESFLSDEIIQNSVLYLILQLHSKPNFTKNDVFLVQNLIIDKILKILLAFTENMSTCQCETKLSITNVLKMYLKSLKSVKNDYALTKTLVKLNLGRDLDKPDYEFIISKQLGVIFKKGCRFFGDLLTTGMLMPLQFQIKEFLSRQSRLSEMIAVMEKLALPAHQIYHILQGSTWKKIKSHFSESQVVIPIGLYTDGMQFNNPLGPHTDHTDMLYYFFPALKDPFHRDNIHVASIIRSKNIQTYGSGSCLISLVRELIKLYFDGIDIEIEGKIINVKIVLCQIIGDNLALNGIMEYVLSFNANFYCRLCQMPKQDAEKSCEEILSKLRTKLNYEQDLEKKNSTLTGVAEDCVFNILPYFHCTLNFSLDLMHDFFEGIFKYDICQALIYFIDNNFITLEELNDRISNFRYGLEEGRYIPNILIRDNLKNNNLKMTAREAWQFFYLLPILIGDKIPEDDEVWELLRTLLKIIEMCLESSFDETKLTLLSSLISKHHTIYMKYFRELKPKMHLITHLPSSIRAMGPPRNYMCFRMEYKHQFFKCYAHSNKNRKNIAKTFAKKYMLHFAYLLLENKPYLEIETGKSVKSVYPDLTSFGHQCYKDLNYRGTDYTAGMYLPLLEAAIYNLYEILEIVTHSNEISIVGKKVGRLSYCPHYVSFSINRETEAETKLITLKNFKSVPLNIYKSHNNRTEFIRPKIFFDQI